MLAQPGAPQQMVAPYQQQITQPKSQQLPPNQSWNQVGQGSPQQNYMNSDSPMLPHSTTSQLPSNAPGAQTQMPQQNSQSVNPPTWNTSHSDSQTYSYYQYTSDQPNVLPTQGERYSLPNQQQGLPSSQPMLPASQVPGPYYKQENYQYQYGNEMNSKSQANLFSDRTQQTNISASQQNISFPPNLQISAQQSPQVNGEAFYPPQYQNWNPGQQTPQQEPYSYPYHQSRQPYISNQPSYSNMVQPSSSSVTHQKQSYPNAGTYSPQEKVRGDAARYSPATQAAQTLAPLSSFPLKGLPSDVHIKNINRILKQASVLVPQVEQFKGNQGRFSLTMYSTTLPVSYFSTTVHVAAANLMEYVTSNQLHLQSLIPHCLITHAWPQPQSFKLYPKRALHWQI